MYSRLTQVALGLLVGLTFFGFDSDEAQAESIHYSFTGSGSGTLDSMAFSDVAFVVSIDADVSQIAFQPFLGTIGAIDLAGSIDLIGIGNTNFSEPQFVYTYLDFVGFGNFATGNSIEIDDASVVGYDLKSNLGPITGPNNFLHQFNNVGTDLGALSFSSMSDVTFTATTSAVPEPSSLALLGLGGIGYCVAAFRMRQSKSACS